MSRITTALRQLFGANPVGIAFGLIVGRSWARTRSFFMGFSLRAPGLHLGPGCRVIGARHISFGKGVFAARNLWLEAVTSYRSQSFHPEITIGDYVCFSDGVHISAISSVIVGSHTLFGSKIYVSDHNHGVYRGECQSRPEEPPAHRRLGGGGPVVIGENVWVGENSVIVGPATIGNGAIIGANSVVRGFVPPNTIVAGTPAKPVKIFNPSTALWEKCDRNS
jgi:acetyltransferase-like isoleucine patch superfamily enzyme